jgi:predicted RecB family nuclease
MAEKQTGRPKAGYRVKDGSRVPGATTPAKHIDGDPGGLIHWAWSLGMEGKDYREERDALANAGTAVHDAVAAILTGEEYQAPPEHARAVEAGVEAFQSWMDATAIDPISYELPLVSEKHRFGGTPDLIGRDGHGRLILADIKTGKIYPAAILQVAAYGILLEESQCDGVAPGEPIAGYHLLRFDRDTGAFTHFSPPLDVVEEAADAFLMCLKLYHLSKRLKKML